MTPLVDAPPATDPRDALRSDSVAPRLRSYPKGTPVVYLLHLHAPFKHARHYVGYTANLRVRLWLYRTGHPDASAFMAAVHAAGIRWHLARAWSFADRAFERKIKDDGQVARLCPVCRRRALARNARNVRARRSLLRKDAPACLAS